jgi:hypothetical protein
VANLIAPKADSRSAEAIFADAMRRTRWHFAALCLYLLSQSFTIPILPLGPSWATWPGLPDVATGLLGLVVIVCGFPRTVQPTRTQAAMFRWLMIIFALCFHSFLLFRFVRITRKTASRGMGDSSLACIRFIDLCSFSFCIGS